jgi:hypothetical protein
MRPPWVELDREYALKHLIMIGEGCDGVVFFMRTAL